MQGKWGPYVSAMATNFVYEIKTDLGISLGMLFTLRFAEQKGRSYEKKGSELWLSQGERPMKVRQSREILLEGRWRHLCRTELWLPLRRLLRRRFPLSSSSSSPSSSPSSLAPSLGVFRLGSAGLQQVRQARQVAGRSRCDFWGVKDIDWC